MSLHYDTLSQLEANKSFLLFLNRTEQNLLNPDKHPS